MCHEEIHRCPRVDLADRDPDAHPDCERGSRVAVELLIREQRLLRTSRARERFRLRLDTCTHKPAASPFSRRPACLTRGFAAVATGGRFRELIWVRRRTRKARRVRTEATDRTRPQPGLLGSTTVQSH